MKKVAQYRQTVAVLAFKQELVKFLLTRVVEQNKKNE